MAASGFHFQPMGPSRYHMGGECLPVRVDDAGPAGGRLGSWLPRRPLCT